MSKDMNIIEINETEFNDKVIEESTKKLIIVDFWAPWCGPCKQLTPILEKVVTGSDEKLTLVKINIDENQQIASQLRIQSIPTVYAFKDKQIVNAFQGVLPEGQIIEFIEKCLGSKLKEDFSEFFKNIEVMMTEDKIDQAKEALIEFISKNPKELQSINTYLECLLKLKEYDEAYDFIESLEEEIKEKEEVKQIIKKLDIIKKNSSGPSIDELIIKLKSNGNDINLILEVSDKYFSDQDYKNCMELLLNNYPKNKEKVKEKMVEFFGVLGNTNEHTIYYRKKLSQLMFS